MFFFNTPFYIITVVLQVICVLHCLRRGTQQNWLWLIIFLPLLGSIIYIFSEMFNRHSVQQVQSSVGEVLNPSGTIRKLEKQVQFADTFNNRIALADACLQAGQTERAIGLYEQSLTGAFAENEHGLLQLIIAYYKARRYDEAIAVGRRSYKFPQFPKSRSHIYYAISLDYAGKPAEAEAEFGKMKGRFANFEARYQYGLFLKRNDRPEEARQLFAAIVQEGRDLDSRQRRFYREWFALAKNEIG